MDTAQDKRFSRVIMYGRDGCKDTDAARKWLQEHQTPFTEININQDAQGECFVLAINNGQRMTPTIVVGDGKMKAVLSVPDEALLESVVRSIANPNA
jgi:glutaredoxin